ncbi:MAG: DNA double-strand break repair nuclease NurA [Candidatus Micrarchaeia archaeon]
MLDGLSEIAEKIKSTEGSRRELAQRLRFNSGKIEYPETLERELVIPVQRIPVAGKIAAVDSGIVGEELHGFNFLLMRSVGAMFTYENSRVVSHDYFPKALPAMQYDMRSGLDSHDVMWHKSLYRLRGELTCAADMVKKHSPTAMLMDGSIAPLLSDKPSEESEIRPLYDEVVAAYKSLYESSWKGNCVLMGVIKDSRSKRFIEMIQKHASGAPDAAQEAQKHTSATTDAFQNRGNEGFMHTSDTNFLHFMLEAGERTCAFPYASAPAKHQVLKDLGQWAGKILSFYIKPVKDDRPLRVEFLSGQKTFSEVASLAHSLSCAHKAYAYPAVLIEADLRAALDGDEFERAYAELFSKLGRSSSIMRLRRNSRPFR